MSSTSYQRKSARAWLLWLCTTTVGLLVFLSTLIPFDSTRLHFVGIIMAGGVLALSVPLVLLFFPKFVKNLRPFPLLTISATAICCLYITSLFVSATPHDLYVIVQTVAIFLFLAAVSLLTWTKSAVQIIGFAFLVNILINLLLLFTASESILRFTGLYFHRNSLAPVMLYSCGFLFLAYHYSRSKLTKLFWLTSSIPALLLLGIANSRAVYLAVLAAVATYILWPLLKRMKPLYYLYFFVVIAGISIVTLIGSETTVISIEDIANYNALAREYTGGRITSGREQIWPTIGTLISERPLLGYGASAAPKTLFDSPWSSHNFYLQIALQIGLIGVFLFFLIFLAIWHIFWRTRANNIVRLAASLFIGVLIHQTFEVSLTQNQMEQALMFWTIIGIGLSVSRGPAISQHGKKYEDRTVSTRR